MPSKTVLIVEDEPIILETLATDIRGRGCNVITANDGEQALEKAKRLKPDLILLDLYIHKIGGLRVCELLKENQGTSNIPVVILSALDTKDTREAAEKFGVKDFLPKPFNIDEIWKTLEKYL